MRIAGLVPCSLIDFPGRTSATLFTQGCNFRCPFCHNGHLIPPMSLTGNLIPADQALARLETRKGLLDGVVISGGEPTLQQGLAGFLRSARSLGLQTKLDTNGSQPDILYGLLADRLLDYIAMDVKAPPHAYERLSGVKAPVPAILESIRLIAASGVPHEFRTTTAPELHTKIELDEIASMIPPGSPHKLQQFRKEHAFDPELRTAVS